MAGPYLERYDLTAGDPESTVEKVQILPLKTEVVQVLSHDSEWVYVRAKGWNEQDNRHDEPKTYATKRDGSQYKEVSEKDVAE